MQRRNARKKPELADRNILGLVDDEMVVGTTRSRHIAEFMKNCRPSDQVSLVERLPYIIKDPPKLFSLRPANSCFPAKSFYIPVIFPGLKVPSIYDMLPLSLEKPNAEIGYLKIFYGLLEEVTKLRCGNDIGLPTGCLH